MNLSDGIQLAIVEVLFLTALFSLFSAIINFLFFKDNKKTNELKLFGELVKEHREAKKTFMLYNKKDKVMAEAIILSFYEYLSLLILNGEIDIRLFYKYFERRFENVYILFKITEGVSGEELYPTLSRLFHLIGLEKD